MPVLSDFDYHKIKHDLHGILCEAATSRTGQNLRHLPQISKVKICIEQSIYNRCGIYPSFQTDFLCSVISKIAPDNKFAIHLQSRENKILESFGDKISIFIIVKEMNWLHSTYSNTRGRICLQAISKYFPSIRTIQNFVYHREIADIGWQFGWIKCVLHHPDSPAILALREFPKPVLICIRVYSVDW